MGQVKITYADGSYVDAEGGKQSSNGLYWTDSNGQITLNNIVGTIIVTEVASIDGYTIHEETRSQTVVVNPDDTQQLYFYNDPIGGVELIKAHQAQRTAANTPIRSFAEDPDMLVKNGRYGAYIAYKGKNYRLPKGSKPEELTLDDCLKIVADSKK